MQMRGLKSKFRRAQSGQSLLILALGFMALIGFVGIVTDVSLLFVRYSSLRRAVDAAAVAAAGQFRRVADDPGPDNLVGTADDVVTGDAASVAQLTLAARQFIEIYGLNPSNVLVETCRAQRVQRDGNGNPIFATPEEDEEEERYAELCTNEELKLVRVTAQIDSPTVFLRLLGQPSIILTESAMSQTAVIDVVLIFDVSESMLNTTRLSDWAALGGDYANIHIPPVLEYSNFDQYQQMLNSSHNDHQTLFTDRIFQPDGTEVATDSVRSECRWFAWPTNWWHGTQLVPQWLRAEYQTVMTPADLLTHFYGSYLFTGFQPTYNYFGCCNDPNGDMEFDDLVCQPFKQARDAAENFLARLDFLRGDRVAFVTFDRAAQLIDPDGTGPQPAIIETERTLDPDGVGPITVGHPQYREGALEVLRRAIGVRAESSFYVDTDTDPSPTVVANDGHWDRIRDYTRERTYADFRSVVTEQIFDFPVANACPFDTAINTPIYSGIDTLPDGSPAPGDYALLDSVLTTPSWFTESDYYVVRRSSYEYRASCSGTNMGGALASGSNALFNLGRREGAVWMMVLLSDGGAGGSNPIIRRSTDTAIPGRAQPFAQNALGNFDPIRGLPPDLTDTTPARDIYPPAGYGSFGVCPYGTSGSPGELLDLSEDDFPYCGDEQPPTRHFCSTLAMAPDSQPMEEYGGCIDTYDVDDYARDWADWVGLANLNSVGGAAGSRTGEQLLPTIFTIGFGLTYDNPNVTCPDSNDRTEWECVRNRAIPDYLGEELLRYIADVGDNFRLDDDYWQTVGVLASDRLPNGIADPLDPNADWGTRNPCQLSLEVAAAQGYASRYDYAPTAPGQDCGNYFNAPSGTKLNEVFNEIASRMFTRLTQ